MTPDGAGPADRLVDHLFRTRAGQMVAWLTRLFGPAHLELAEEVVQDALVKALQRWPYSGIPADPTAWLYRVARNRALDVLRRHATFRDREAAIVAELGRRAEAGGPPAGTLEDDELRLVFMCCHPSLPRDARVALSLKTVGGFGVREIARAFLVADQAIAQRLVRAKRQIRESGLSLDLPGPAELAGRLESVLEVIYLLFNEGYHAHGGDDLVRTDLCGEALRLGRLVAAAPAVATPTVHALVALMAFHAARLPARVDDGGDLVRLDEQDRALWDRRLVHLAFRHFARSADGTTLSPYHVQAAIAAVHARAASAADTRWDEILVHYDQLLALNPSPVVALNRAVALSKVAGAAAGLAALEALEADPALRSYHLLPAVKGQLLAETGDRAGAARCYQAALDRPCSEPERRFLQRRLASVTPNP